jgi:aspartate racemase
MKTAGIVGGIAPESTIAYYRLIIATYRDRKRDGSYPPIIINSIDMKRMLDLIGRNQLTEVTDYLLSEVHKLASSGADFGLMASNTPHIVFDELNRQSPIPMISIVEVACQSAKALGLKRLALFGTRFTMQGGFYNDIFSKHGIVLTLPDINEQSYIHEKYMGELVNGVFLPETRQQLLTIANRLQETDNIQGVILGGTELPLILEDESYGGIPFLDTTKIHVKEIVNQILS